MRSFVRTKPRYFNGFVAIVQVGISLPVLIQKRQFLNGNEYGTSIYNLYQLHKLMILQEKKNDLVSLPLQQRHLVRADLKLAVAEVAYSAI